MPLSPRLFPLRRGRQTPSYILRGILQPSPTTITVLSGIGTGSPQPLIFALRKSLGLGNILAHGVATNLVDPIVVGQLPPQPLLFLLKGRNRIAYPRTQPLPTLRLFISGTTRDKDGTALAACTVSLFRTADNVLMEQLTSNGVGAFSFAAVGLSETYYVVAYKAGPQEQPDVAGTTVHTLVGVA
jgi:hypothetical protein